MMQPKDLATVRMSNLLPDLKERQLREFLESENLYATSNISLCPHRPGKDFSRVATVTFQSQSIAKQALNLNGRVLGGRNVIIERDFVGFTVLAAPEAPKLEYGLTVI